MVMLKDCHSQLTWKEVKKIKFDVWLKYKSYSKQVILQYGFQIARLTTVWARISQSYQSECSTDTYFHHPERIKGKINVCEISTRNIETDEKPLNILPGKQTIPLTHRLNFVILIVVLQSFYFNFMFKYIR